MYGKETPEVKGLIDADAERGAAWGAHWECPYGRTPRALVTTKVVDKHLQNHYSGSNSVLGFRKGTEE